MKQYVTLAVLLLLISLQFQGTSAFFSTHKEVPQAQMAAGWWVAPQLSMLAPTESSICLPEGEIYDITWFAESSDPAAVTAITITLSVDGGVTYPHTLATNIANTGSYSWLVDNPVTTPNMRIKIFAADSHGLISTAESGVFSFAADESLCGPFNVPSLLSFVSSDLQTEYGLLPTIPQIPNQESNTSNEIESDLDEAPASVPEVGAIATQSGQLLHISVDNADAITSIRYYLEYTHQVEGVVVSEMIEGEFESISQAHVDIQPLYLGTCSSAGEVCVPHQQISQLELNLLYKKQDDIIKTETISPNWNEPL